MGENIADMTKLLDLDEFLDSNVEQSVRLPISSSRKCKYMKITFGRSTDFFGRVTVYKLQVFGSICNPQ